MSEENQNMIIAQCDTEWGFINPGFLMSVDIDLEESVANEQEVKIIETAPCYSTLGSDQKYKDEHGEIGEEEIEVSEESTRNEEEAKTTETSPYHSTFGSHQEERDENGEICDSEETANNEETKTIATLQIFNDVGCNEKTEDGDNDAVSRAAQISEFVEGNTENAGKDTCNDRKQELFEYQNGSWINNSLSCVSLESNSIRSQPTQKEAENSEADLDKNRTIEKNKNSNSRNPETELETISSLVKSLHCRRNAAVSAADIPELKIVMEQKEKRKKKYNVILDKGWAWMVLLSSFLAHIIVDGAASSFGVFYVLFLEEFGKSRGLTSWIGSLQVSLMYLMGKFF